MDNLFSQVKITTKDLISRKGRSFLTVLGIVIGVSGVIIIISLGAGAKSLVLGQITKLGSDIVAVLPGKTNEKGPPASVFGVQIKTLSNNDAEAIKNRALYVAEVSRVVSSNVNILSAEESVDTSFTAVDGNYPKILNIEIEKGYFFNDEQAKAGDNVIVLGHDVAEQLFPNGNEIGQIVKIKIPNNSESQGQNIGSIPFRVIGVQKKMGTVAFQNQDDQVFIPFSIGQKQLLGIDYIQFIRIKIDNSENINLAMDSISQVIREQHRIKNPTNDDFEVRNLADAIKLLENITSALQVFLGLMAGISLIVGGIGIMNIMLVTVSERTREIGLRKAVGATRKQIKNKFLFEAVVLTSAGGIIGIIIGILFSYLIAIGVRLAGYDWSFVISPMAIILAVGVSVLIGIIFGLYPAIKASKLDPIVALRYE